MSKSRLLKAIGSVAAGGLLAATAAEAIPTLYMTTDKSTYDVGETINLAVRLDTDGTFINYAQGTVAANPAMSPTGISYPNVADDLFKYFGGSDNSIGGSSFTRSASDPGGVNGSGALVLLTYTMPDLPEVDFGFFDSILRQPGVLDCNYRCVGTSVGRESIPEGGPGLPFVVMMFAGMGAYATMKKQGKQAMTYSSRAEERTVSPKFHR